MAVDRTRAERCFVAKRCWSGEGGCLDFLARRVQKTKSEASKLFQLLRSYLLDHGLPDLVLHPGRRALGLLSTCNRSPQLDVRVAPVGRVQGRLAEDAGIQEVSSRQKLSRRKVTPHILWHSHVVNALMSGRAGANDPEACGSQEAVYDGDLRHGGAGAGE
jgi:hypothetical protein